ncbi:hypothetical protein IQ243_19145 [Nostocales cyanobacterium LEGE 11386]|nr:hypothetical protein [Nostocales cyanobacterium LEGE 11386]
MRAKIKEEAITDFQHIYHLDQTKKRLLGNIVNVLGATSHIVSAFYKQSSLRPSLKKVGIYVKLVFKHVQKILDEKYYEQIIYRYLQEIGWSDLQYIAFIAVKRNFVEIDIILNRVISSTQIIDLKCLGATWMQYEILQKAYTDIINTANTKFLRSQNSGFRINSDF